MLTFSIKNRNHVKKLFRTELAETTEQISAQSRRDAVLISLCPIPNRATTQRRNARFNYLSAQCPMPSRFMASQHSGIFAALRHASLPLVCSERFNRIKFRSFLRGEDAEG